MIDPIDPSGKVPQLDDELDVLLFDPVDEWLLDPADQSRSQLLSCQMLSADKGVKLEVEGGLIEEEMKRVKLEEGDEMMNLNKESEEVVGVEDASSAMEDKEIVGVKLEEEKVEQEESQKVSDVRDSHSSMEEKQSEEVKAEGSSSSSDEESSSEEDEEEEEREGEEESSDGESSSGASSSESSEESSDEEKEIVRGKDEDIEEGEIVMESDEEEGEGGLKGAKSINEKEVLPPVPKIDVQLEPHHQTVPIGEILSILGDRVIVEGSVNHSPLNEGSILWVTQTRTPLGLVDEVFGPVKSPFYLIRYNSNEDVPPGITVGTTVSFVSEFASYVLNNNKDVYQKGYDVGDDEIGDEVEFSDDEKEAEYKRALRQAKRGYNKSKEKQSEPAKSRRNVNSMKKNDGNFAPQFPQNQMPQNQFSQNQFQQNQFQQNQFPKNQFQQNQFTQNQQPQFQFPQNQMMQNQLPQNQMLQNQLLMSILASGMQMPGFGLPMTLNTNPNQFMFGGMNFPQPSNMQLNPGNMPSGTERPPMQGNSYVPNIHMNPVNVQPQMQFQPGNLCMGAQGSNLQSSPGSLSFGGDCSTMEFNPAHSGSLQFNPGNSRGEGSNLPFGSGNFSNRGGRPNQRGRGRGRHFSGRNGNPRPRNG